LPASSSNRIQIQRSSSSDDSNGSEEIVTKRTRQRRKKPTASNERSNILKQMKRKTQEKKNTVTTTSTIDNNNNNSHNDSGGSLNGTKKCQFQFSDDDDDDNTNHHNNNNNNKKTNNDDDDGGTTESYEVENDDDKHTSKNGHIKSEDDDDDSSPTKRKNGHGGRKNIRKIIDDKELDTQTKHAVEAELERRKRIAEKQKEYNDNLLEQTTYKTTIENEEINNSNHRLILELDPTTNEALIEVSPKLVKQFKPHQCDGIRFLWNNVFESLDAIENKKHNGNGCILAHCMGLGKTLQVISFIHTIFNYDKLTNVRTCLVLCPINAGNSFNRISKT
jgi:transcriptional regulator ATRX